MLLLPSIVRPLAKDPRVLIGWPLPLGLVWSGACYWNGVGGFMFNSSSSDCRQGAKKQKVGSFRVAELQGGRSRSRYLKQLSFRSTGRAEGRREGQDKQRERETIPIGRNPIAGGPPNQFNTHRSDFKNFHIEKVVMQYIIMLLSRATIPRLVS